jgi:hypothetical protein
MYIHIPGRSFRSPESEVVFRPEIFRIFSVDSCQFSGLSGRNPSKIMGKNRKIFPVGILILILAISGVFLEDAVRTS